MGIVEYQIPLNGIAPTDLDGIKDLIESNSEIFNNYLLAGFGGDAGYSVIEGSFEVINIEIGGLEYTASIHYFAGCRNLNDVDSTEGGLEFDVEDEKIKFSIDETVWNVE